MEDVQIKLSALWTALMLTYLLGDVLRIYSGDFIAGEIGGNVAGNCSIDGDPGGHDSPVHLFKTAPESLGEHHRGHFLFYFQSHWIAHVPVRL